MKVFLMVASNEKPAGAGRRAWGCENQFEFRVTTNEQLA